METQYGARTPPAAREAETQQASRGGLTFVLATIFLDMLGAAILIPVQAYIVRLYNTDALVVGLLSVVYSAAQFGAAPILGWLSDRYGRRPVLLVSVLGSALGYYVFGTGGALGQISVTLPAFAAGTLSLLSVIFGYFMLPESLPKEKRTTASFKWSNINPLAAILESWGFWVLSLRPLSGYSIPAVR